MKRFEGQALHAAALAGLGAAMAAATALPGFLRGESAGLSTTGWLIASIAVAVGHQLYVWFFWRWELHGKAITRTLGAGAFPAFFAGFVLLLLARPAPLTALAWSNRHTVAIPVVPRWILCVALALPMPYLIYSTTRYLGWRRVAGIDHFEPAVAETGLVRKGIFRWTPNALYTFGPLGLWIPGIALQSSAALAAAAFMHVSIWVHYACTERPDLRTLYGAGRVQ